MPSQSSLPSRATRKLSAFTSESFHCASQSNHCTTAQRTTTTMSLIPATRMLLKFRPTTPLLTPRLQQLQVRHASSSSIKPPRKPIVLEKPAKFNPPSHAARLPRRAPRGAALPTYGRSEKEKEGGRKRYPNMMPEEGTFLHWFLTSKGVHVWITMVSYPSVSASPSALLSSALLRDCFARLSS